MEKNMFFFFVYMYFENKKKSVYYIIIKYNFGNTLLFKTFPRLYGVEYNI